MALGLARADGDGDADGLVAHVDGFGEPARQHEGLAEAGEHGGPLTGRRLGRDEPHRLLVGLDVAGAVGHPQVPAEALVEEAGTHGLLLGVDGGDGLADEGAGRGRSRRRAGRRWRSASGGRTGQRRTLVGVGDGVPQVEGHAEVDDGLGERRRLARRRGRPRSPRRTPPAGAWPRTSGGRARPAACRAGVSIALAIRAWRRARSPGSSSP